MLFATTIAINISIVDTLDTSNFSYCNFSYCRICTLRLKVTYLGFGLLGVVWGGQLQFVPGLVELEAWEPPIVISRITTL